MGARESHRQVRRASQSCLTILVGVVSPREPRFSVGRNAAIMGSTGCSSIWRRFLHPWILWDAVERRVWCQDFHTRQTLLSTLTELKLTAGVVVFRRGRTAGLGWVVWGVSDLYVRTP